MVYNLLLTNTADANYCTWLLHSVRKKLYNKLFFGMNIMVLLKISRIHRTYPHRPDVDFSRHKKWISEIHSTKVWIGIPRGWFLCCNADIPWRSMLAAHKSGSEIVSPVCMRACVRARAYVYVLFTLATVKKHMGDPNASYLK